MENPVDESELLGLPAELDDIFIANERFFNSESGLTHSFPTEFPYDSSPALSSPVESVIGSAETESSDEEEFFAGLTQRLTQFSLGETQQFPRKSEKKMVTSGSPQSTLNGIGSWSFNSVSSGNGSPNGVSSPPTTAFDGENDTWDLIYQAAGQVARLKTSNEVPNNKFNNQIKGLLGTPSNVNPNNLLYTNQYHCPRHEQKQPALWGRQQFKVGNQWQQPISQSRVRNFENGLSQSAWPPLQMRPQYTQQQQKPHLPESGMRAMFLQGSGVKRESAGTGVFLPRRYGAPPVEPRKKTGCSTVLVPAKVVQALNLQAQARANPNFAPNYDPRNVILAQQKRTLNQCPEAALPQDWSY